MSKNNTTRRIVIKIGSNVLTRADGRPDITHMAQIVSQVAEIRTAGHQVIMVSSGAVACGRSMVSPGTNLDAVGQRQVFSAVGQIKLLNIYSAMFAEYGITIGQVLTQKDNFANRRAYLNQRSCIDALLESGVLPILNENDTTSLTELMFTDNDELAGLVASMTDASMLVILSNVDGIFTGDPSEPDSTLIRRVNPGDDLSGVIVARKSGFGRGGMGTKYGVAQRLAGEGVDVIIANGLRPGIISDVVLGDIDRDNTPCTHFIAADTDISPVRRWLARSSSFAKGTIHVNEHAAEVLLSDRAVSLLPIGATSIEGTFDEGDIIAVADSQGHRIAVGRAACDADTARAALGRHGERPLIHYDYLFIE